MKLSDFTFPLPEELIAQRPLPERDQSRMMVVDRASQTWEHRKFQELPSILSNQQFLVFNSTRVFPARLWANRPGKSESIEVLLLREEGPGRWQALVRPARKTQIGAELQIASLRAQVIETGPEGRRTLLFETISDLWATIEKYGEPPLPPYIRRGAEGDFGEDVVRYQTVYAKERGSIAAPTAGLHFSERTLAALDQKGVRHCEVLLHIGYGTFQPVRSEEIERHQMESEYFEISEKAARCLREQRAAGRTLIAVGTTTTRVLEHAAKSLDGEIEAISGWCNLFIHPGYRFRMIEGLLTNFHLPGSTLLMLVSALAGREFILECYREAVDQKYRFYSYGDCMLIL